MTHDANEVSRAPSAPPNEPTVAALLARVEHLEGEGARLRRERQTLRIEGAAFLQAVDALCDWMNGNDMVADHEDQEPEDFRVLCERMVSFRALLAETEPSSATATPSNDNETSGGAVRDGA